MPVKEKITTFVAMNISKYNELLGKFLIDCAKIIVGSVIIAPFVSKSYDWTMLVIGGGSTLITLFLGLFISKFK
jgi:uncharacterized membrane protein